MHSVKSKGLQVLLAATVAAMVVTPVAIAGADNPVATGSAQSQVAKQIKQLKKQAATLAKQAAALAGQVTELTAKTAALEGKKAPTTLPPSGPAGGDLTGIFPNPGLGANTVGEPEIATDAVGAAEITTNAVRVSEIAEDAVGTGEVTNGSIQGVDLAGGSVGGTQFNGALFERGVEVAIKPGETKPGFATCPAGSRLLSGGFEWIFGDRDDTIVSSGPSEGSPNTTWAAQGRVPPGAVEGNSLLVTVLCLAT